MTIQSKSIGHDFLSSIRRLYVRNARFILTFIVKGLLAVGVLPLQIAIANDAGRLSAPVHPPAEDALPRAIITTKTAEVYHPKRADFKRETAAHEARSTADWVIDSEDNRSMPFVIIDKTNAKVFVFDTNGRLQGAARALLGLARGDDAVPGIGERKLSTIRPEERTTPAGRFVAALDHNLHGDEILWVDYDDAISMHRVITTNKREHRLKRLGTSTTDDKRISYGCINVPVRFFNNIVLPAFKGTNGIVYVLPETRPARDVFGSYNVDEHPQQPKPGKSTPLTVP